MLAADIRLVGLLLALVCVAACGAPAAATPSPARSGQVTSPATPAPTTVAGCVDCIVRDDPALTVSFAAPRAFPYAPARVIPATDLYLTDTARLSSYALDAGPRDVGDILIELFLAPRHGEALTTIAAERFSTTGTTQRSLMVAGRDALRLEGDFQSGKRAYVLVGLDSERVLIASALPRDSTRLADFERLLQTLAVR